MAAAVPSIEPAAKGVTSSPSAYEYFVSSIVSYVIFHHALFDTTAILVTFDEGGGYYDSGYVQPLDFFGDGTRIPLMVVSPYVRPGANRSRLH
jgi:phospholipase C